MDFSKCKEHLSQNQYHWLVTGCAGFIGSHLLETLLMLNQKVTGIDDLSTGYLHNLEDVKKNVSEERYSNFQFINASISSLEHCERACKDVDYVLHQGALGSVPRSIESPCTSNIANVDGTLNIFFAAKKASIKKIVYASSSSVYGTDSSPYKIESNVGEPLSPYAVTKKVNELYAKVFSDLYDQSIVGLRYFNVFGPRQDPNGAYAAVIPRWIGSLLKGQECFLFGDGSTSRDFCYIKNIVQANLLAALCDNRTAIAGNVFNIAVGDTTNLNQLYAKITNALRKLDFYKTDELPKVVYKDFRKGDIKHSLADVSKAKKVLGYLPSHTIDDGIEETVAWYLRNHS